MPGVHEHPEHVALQEGQLVMIKRIPTDDDKRYWDGWNAYGRMDETPGMVGRIGGLRLGGIFPVYFKRSDEERAMDYYWVYPAFLLEPISAGPVPESWLDD